MRAESMFIRGSMVLILGLLVLALTGCASSGGSSYSSARTDYGNSATFPVPPEIAENVDFWRHVYGIWSRGEVAIHDSEHMGVIYEVAKIPGPIQGGYSHAQSAWVKSRVDLYSNQLKDLEQRMRSRQSMTPTDKKLLAKFQDHGGSSAVYGASDRIRAQRGLRERFHRGVEISGRYDKLFREIMNTHGVPEDLAYLPHVESSFQTNARSSVGAGGVWQFMPATGRQYMTLNSAVDERFDPILAADGAARYLAAAYRMLGSWPLAITSYNHGKGGMSKAKAIHGNDIGRIVKEYKGPYFGFASRNFYAEFIAAREVAGNAKRYFPEGIRYEEPWTHDRLVLRHSMPATHLARHYGTSSSQLANLNLHWRDSIHTGNAHLPAGTTIWLPQGTLRRVSSQPPPVRVIVASSDPKPTPQSRPTLAKTNRVAAKAKPKAQAKKLVKARYHVVKPKETLYRVAVENGLSVSELRRLNKMHPNDNNIRPGQKLKVGI